MGNRQVSVSIRAAFDSAFRSTFATADSKVRELNESLKAMRQTSGEMKGLSRVRQEISGLNGTLQRQKTELSGVIAEKAKAIAVDQAFSARINEVKAAAKTAEAEHKRLSDALVKESAAVQQSLKPTADKIQALERMKIEVRDAREALTLANRETLNAAKSLETQSSHLGKVSAKLREHSFELVNARQHVVSTAESYRKLRSEYEQQRLSLKKVTDPTHEQTTALALLKDRVSSAKRAMSESEREMSRLSRSIDTQGKLATQAAAGHTAFEERLRSAKSAAASAAREHDRLNGILTKHKMAMAAGPTTQQTAALKALEISVTKSGAAFASAKVEFSKAADEQRAYKKAAQQSETTVEHLSKKERELSGSLATTEAQIKRATEASDRYSKSLIRQGYDVQHLDQAEKAHLETMERVQKARRRGESSRDMMERARDLRSQAQTSLYFTLGYGFLFTRPIREAVEFEKAMIRVKAMAGASSDEFRRLREDARRLGAETIYSAIDVAQAQNELATAGFRTDEVISIMPHMLDLANSSMTGLARTAEITSEVLQGFSLDVTEMKRVGDALTAAYSGSASSLDSLGEMLKYVSSVAVDVNSTLEQTLAASSVLHNSGIKGSMAGTGMRSLFLRLSDPPAKLRKMLKDMDIDVKDSQGNMRNWISIIHDINRALEGTGTAAKAAAWKKLAGEDHAPTASKLAAAEKSGALQLETKKYEMAPSFNALGRSLLQMPEADIQKIERDLSVKFNRAMSGGGLVSSLAGSMKGLKGKEFEDQLQTLFRKLKISPSLADIKPEEYQAQGRRTEDALRRLQIDPKKRMGGMKNSLELTREIKTQLQTLSVSEQLQYVELFFSKTRHGVAQLMKELSRGGKDAADLMAGLNDTLGMDQTRKELSKSAAYDLEQVKGDFSDIVVSLGDSLLPILKDFIRTIKPITEGFAKWIQVHQGFAKSIMLALGGLLAFNAAVGLVRFGLSGIISTVGAGKKIGEFFGADGFGRAAGKGVWGGTKWTAGKGLKAMKWGGGALVSGFSKLISLGPRILFSMGVVFNVIRALGLLMVTTPIGLVITGLVIGAILIWRNWSTVGPWLVRMWGHLKVFFVNLWTSIVSVMKMAWEFIKTYLGWNPVVYMIKNWEKLVDMFKWVWEKAKPYIKMLFPGVDSEINISGPDKEPGFLSRVIDSGKEVFSGIFSSENTPNASAPAMPMTERIAEKGSYTQRNVITVNANIHVDSGSAAPAQVASKIKGEIQSAFRNTPSFSFIDPVMVS